MRFRQFLFCSNFLLQLLLDLRIIYDVYILL